MRRAVVIGLCLFASAAYAATPGCFGLGCAYFMAPLGDGSLRDRQIAICNQHALPTHQGWEQDFANCKTVYDQWLGTDVAKQALAAAAQRAADKAVIDAVEK